MQIDKVVTVLCNWEDMQEINELTGIDEFATDNWCDKTDFIENKDLCNYIGNDEFKAIMNNEIDYIAFRVDG